MAARSTAGASETGGGGLQLRPAVSHDYAVLHLVAGEAHKDLIGPQVVDHLAAQRDLPGEGRPAIAAVGLIEPARVALRAAVRARVRELGARAAGVRVALLPYVGRLGLGANARLLAPRVRALVGRRPVVFHCRGEGAVEWAAALARHCGRAGIVADIRGAGPEEALFARGFDGPDAADARARREYHVHLSRLHAALADAGVVLSVSPGMLDWLHGLGVSRDQLVYVPCCVPRLRYSERVRAEVRQSLGLTGKVVYSYVGIIARYQHIDDGLVPFVRETTARHDDAHLLALTDEPERMRGLLEAGGVPGDRATVLRVPQTEVGTLLSAADCGCILKAPSHLNRTWQPIKLGEYLASGVPVVVSRGVGSVDSLIERAGAGVVVDVFDRSPGDLAAEVERTYRLVRERGDAMRRCALALCEREFLWSEYVDVVRSAYRRALQ